MSDIIQKRIDNMRLRTDKHGDKWDAGLVSDLSYLADQLEVLMMENKILREQIFIMEQEAPEEQRWENWLAAKLQRAITHNDDYYLRNIKKDYVEITNSINNDIFVITIQKKHGKTPEQLREQSEIRRLKAIQKIVNLLKQNKQMAAKLSQQFTDIQKLTTIRTYPETLEAKSKEELEQIIARVNELIKRFNKDVYSRQLSKLQPSMKASFHEAWTRAATSDAKARTLEKENKQLKLELMKKKHPTSRILKRKRGK